MIFFIRTMIQSNGVTAPRFLIHCTREKTLGYWHAMEECRRLNTFEYQSSQKVLPHPARHRPSYHWLVGYLRWQSGDLHGEIATMYRLRSWVETSVSEDSEASVQEYWSAMDLSCNSDSKESSKCVRCWNQIMFATSVHSLPLFCLAARCHWKIWGVISFSLFDHFCFTIKSGPVQISRAFRVQVGLRTSGSSPGRKHFSADRCIRPTLLRPFGGLPRTSAICLPFLCCPIEAQMGHLVILGKGCEG